MNNIKNRLFILLIVLFCVQYFQSSSAFALVVHDPKNYVQAVNQLKQTAKHYGKEITHWQEQIHQVKEQNNMMKNQLASITGVRDIGDLEGELLSLKKELRGIEKHRDKLNSLLRSTNPEENEYANEILGKYQMFNVCKENGSKKLDNICKEEILNKAATIEAGEAIRKQTERKVIETAKLAGKAKNTKDMKESQDLSNAIALKDTEITQLKNQWDSFVDESNLREKLIEEKRRETFDEHQRNAPIPQFEFK